MNQVCIQSMGESGDILDIRQNWKTQVEYSNCRRLCKTFMQYVWEACKASSLAKIDAQVKVRHTI